MHSLSAFAAGQCAPTVASSSTSTASAVCPSAQHRTDAFSSPAPLPSGSTGRADAIEACRRGAPPDASLGFLAPWATPETRRRAATVGLGAGHRPRERARHQGAGVGGGAPPSASEALAMQTLVAWETVREAYAGFEAELAGWTEAFSTLTRTHLAPLFVPGAAPDGPTEQALPRTPHHHAVVQCVRGPFAGRFFYVNKGRKGDILGGGKGNREVTMYIEHAGLSEAHAQLVEDAGDNATRKENTLVLIDLHSENGTWVRLRWDLPIPVCSEPGLAVSPPPLLRGKRCLAALAKRRSGDFSSSGSSSSPLLPAAAAPSVLPPRAHASASLAHRGQTPRRCDEPPASPANGCVTHAGDEGVLPRPRPQGGATSDSYQVLHFEGTLLRLSRGDPLSPLEAFDEFLKAFELSHLEREILRGLQQQCRCHENTVQPSGRASCSFSAPSSESASPPSSLSSPSSLPSPSSASAVDTSVSSALPWPECPKHVRRPEETLLWTAERGRSGVSLDGTGSQPPDPLFSRNQGLSRLLHDADAELSPSSPRSPCFLSRTGACRCLRNPLVRLAELSPDCILSSPRPACRQGEAAEQSEANADAHGSSFPSILASQLPPVASSPSRRLSSSSPSLAVSAVSLPGSSPASPSKRGQITFSAAAATTQWASQEGAPDEVSRRHSTAEDRSMPYAGDEGERCGDNTPSCERIDDPWSCGGDSKDLASEDEATAEVFRGAAAEPPVVPARPSSCSPACQLTVPPGSTRDGRGGGCDGDEEEAGEDQGARTELSHEDLAKWQLACQELPRFYLPLEVKSRPLEIFDLASGAFLGRVGWSGACLLPSSSCCPSASPSTPSASSPSLTPCPPSTLLGPRPHQAAAASTSTRSPAASRFPHTSSHSSSVTTWSSSLADAAAVGSAPLMLPLSAPSPESFTKGELAEHAAAEDAHLLPLKASPAPPACQFSPSKNVSSSLFQALLAEGPTDAAAGAAAAPSPLSAGEREDPKREELRLQTRLSPAGGRHAERRRAGRDERGEDGGSDKAGQRAAPELAVERPALLQKVGMRAEGVSVASPTQQRGNSSLSERWPSVVGGESAESQTPGGGPVQDSLATPAPPLESGVRSGEGETGQSRREPLAREEEVHGAEEKLTDAGRRKPEDDRRSGGTREGETNTGEADTAPVSLCRLSPTLGEPSVAQSHEPCSQFPPPSSTLEQAAQADAVGDDKRKRAVDELARPTENKGGGLCHNKSDRRGQRRTVSLSGPVPWDRRAAKGCASLWGSDAPRNSAASSSVSTKPHRCDYFSDYSHPAQDRPADRCSRSASSLGSPSASAPLQGHKPAHPESPSVSSPSLLASSSPSPAAGVRFPLAKCGKRFAEGPQPPALPRSAPLQRPASAESPLRPAVRAASGTFSSPSFFLRGASTKSTESESALQRKNESGDGEAAPQEKSVRGAAHVLQPPEGAHTQVETTRKDGAQAERLRRMRTLAWEDTDNATEDAEEDGRPLPGAVSMRRREAGGGVAREENEATQIPRPRRLQLSACAEEQGEDVRPPSDIENEVEGGITATAAGAKTDDDEAAGRGELAKGSEGVVTEEDVRRCQTQAEAQGGRTTLDARDGEVLQREPVETTEEAGLAGERHEGGHEEAVQRGEDESVVRKNRTTNALFAQTPQHCTSPTLPMSGASSSSAERTASLHQVFTSKYTFNDEDRGGQIPLERPPLFSSRRSCASPPLAPKPVAAASTFASLAGLPTPQARSNATNSDEERRGEHEGGNLKGQLLRDMHATLLKKPFRRVTEEEEGDKEQTRGTQPEEGARNLQSRQACEGAQPGDLKNRDNAQTETDALPAARRPQKSSRRTPPRAHAVKGRERETDKRREGEQDAEAAQSVSVDVKLAREKNQVLEGTSREEEGDWIPHERTRAREDKETERHRIARARENEFNCALCFPLFSSIPSALVSPLRRFQSSPSLRGSSSSLPSSHSSVPASLASSFSPPPSFEPFALASSSSFSADRCGTAASLAASPSVSRSAASTSPSSSACAPLFRLGSSPLRRRMAEERVNPTGGLDGERSRRLTSAPRPCLAPPTKKRTRAEPQQEGFERAGESKERDRGRGGWAPGSLGGGNEHTELARLARAEDKVPRRSLLPSGFVSSSLCLSRGGEKVADASACTRQSEGEGKKSAAKSTQREREPTGKRGEKQTCEERHRQVDEGEAGAEEEGLEERVWKGDGEAEAEDVETQTRCSRGAPAEGQDEEADAHADGDQKADEEGTICTAEGQEDGGLLSQMPFRHLAASPRSPAFAVSPPRSSALSSAPSVSSALFASRCLSYLSSSTSFFPPLFPSFRSARASSLSSSLPSSPRRPSHEPARRAYSPPTPRLGASSSSISSLLPSSPSLDSPFSRPSPLSRPASPSASCLSSCSPPAARDVASSSPDAFSSSLLPASLDDSVWLPRVQCMRASPSADSREGARRAPATSGKEARGIASSQQKGSEVHQRGEKENNADSACDASRSNGCSPLRAVSGATKEGPERDICFASESLLTQKKRTADDRGHTLSLFGQRQATEDSTEAGDDDALRFDADEAILSRDGGIHESGDGNDNDPTSGSAPPASLTTDTPSVSTLKKDEAIALANSGEEVGRGAGSGPQAPRGYQRDGERKAAQPVLAPAIRHNAAVVGGALGDAGGALGDAGGALGDAGVAVHSRRAAARQAASGDLAHDACAPTTAASVRKNLETGSDSGTPLQSEPGHSGLGADSGASACAPTGATLDSDYRFLWGKKSTIKDDTVSWRTPIPTTSHPLHRGSSISLGAHTWRQAGAVSSSGSGWAPPGPAPVRRAQIATAIGGEPSGAGTFLGCAAARSARGKGGDEEQKKRPALPFVFYRQHVGFREARDHLLRHPRRDRPVIVIPVSSSGASSPSPLSPSCPVSLLAEPCPWSTLSAPLSPSRRSSLAPSPLPSSPVLSHSSYLASSAPVRMLRGSDSDPLVSASSGPEEKRPLSHGGADALQHHGSWCRPLPAAASFCSPLASSPPSVHSSLAPAVSPPAASCPSRDSAVQHPRFSSVSPSPPSSVASSRRSDVLTCWNCGAEGRGVLALYFAGAFQLLSLPSKPSQAAAPSEYFLSLAPHCPLSLSPDAAFRLGRRLEFAVLRFCVGVKSARGCRRTMEDAELVVQDLRVSSAFSCSFFGVYDGHGGRDCAEFVKRHLHLTFRQQLLQLCGQLELSPCVNFHIFQALYFAFLLTDAAYLKRQRDARAHADAVRAAPPSIAASRARFEGSPHAARAADDGLGLLTPPPPPRGDLLGETGRCAHVDAESHAEPAVALEAATSASPHPTAAKTATASAPGARASDGPRGPAYPPLSLGGGSRPQARPVHDELPASRLAKGGSASGCASVVVVVVGGAVWCANCGDARAVLACGGRAVDLSSDHKPTRRDELNRIIRAGGFVRGRRVLGRLAVSRAFGDIEYKGSLYEELEDEDACAAGGEDSEGREREERRGEEKACGEEKAPTARPAEEGKKNSKVHGCRGICSFENPTRQTAHGRFEEGKQLYVGRRHGQGDVFFCSAFSSLPAAPSCSASTDGAEARRDRWAGVGTDGEAMKKGGSQESFPKATLSEKRRKIYREPLVIAVPEIRLHILSPSDDFLLLACDGLFDVFSSQEAVAFIYSRLSAMPPYEQDPQKAVDELVAAAIEERNTRDNVTAILVVFNPIVTARS
ncbi:hypothetical protein BESB_009500 [Besnoitia besnoiti]|uniref:protein-serine/threonine phosphatase n=1 Tax=Besnoitia besnoiti TaxID=94643 RepID=A0A2A9MJ87_BESBE|nr:hypothetical protein BESB_009500 [Besnoitia besnoiti]PFH38608.1 hypothetical protein BESB_009500 [Besnoitia besnoiti]